MTTVSKIPATVITGFLGAGKTTLVRHLLAHAGGRRIALIVNEFGDVGVDGELLASCGVPGCSDDDIIELANGCLCCTVADEFVPTMERLLARPRPPEHVVIETSGLALPKPLVKAFEWPAIRSKMTVDGVIAVVDGPAWADGRFTSTPEEMARPDHDNPLEEVFSDQLACADMVLLNKADLLPENRLPALAGALSERLRPGVKLLATRQGAVDPRVVLGLSAAAEDDLAARPTLHDTATDHDHDDFESFAVDVPPLANPAAVTGRLNSVIASHDILRLKGFLAIAGKDMRHVVQAVGARIASYYDRPWRLDEERAGRLVVIGRKGLDRPAIADGILAGVRG
jgi:cobalamin biosynthesis protein CobW